MATTTCPVIANENDENIELSTYDRTVGTFVVISCKGFARQVKDPTNVECLATGAWSATPNLECYTALDERETIIVGVAAGCAGLVILVLICIWCYCCCYRRRRRPGYRKDGPPRWYDRWNVWNRDEPDYFRSSRKVDDDFNPRGTVMRESFYHKSRRDDDFRETMKNDDFRKTTRTSFDGSFRKSRRYSDDDSPLRRTMGDLGRSRAFDDDEFRRTRRNSFGESSFRRTRKNSFDEAPFRRTRRNSFDEAPFRRTRRNSFDDPPLRRTMFNDNDTTYRRTRRYSDGGKSEREEVWERGPIRVIEDGIIKTRTPGVKEHTREYIQGSGQPMASNFGQSIVRREVTAPSVIREVSQPTMIRQVAQPTVIREVAQPTIIREVAQPSVIREVAQPTYIREVAQPSVIREVAQPTIVREVSQPMVSEIMQPTIVKYSDQPILRSVQENVHQSIQSPISGYRHTTRYIRPVQTHGYSYGMNGVYGGGSKIVPAANIRELDGDPPYSTIRTGHYELSTTKRDPYDTRSNTNYFFGRQDYPYEDSKYKRMYTGNGK
ncbi:hypothetical protein ACF0H5_024342 [Mactra antiquata]